MAKQRPTSEPAEDDFEVNVHFDPRSARFWLECDSNSFQRYCEKFADDLQHLSAADRAQVVSIEVIDAQGWGRHLKQESLRRQMGYWFAALAILGVVGLAVIGAREVMTWF
jgi:hypothetical protein